MTMKYSLMEKITKGIREQMNPEEITEWKTFGIDTLEEIEGWLKAGITSPEEAGKWREYTTPDNVKALLEIGDYDTVVAWITAGIASPEDIKAWMAFSDNPEEAAEWKRICKDVDTANAWIEAGFGKDAVGREEIEASIDILTPEQAQILKDADMTSSTVEEYLSYGLSIDDIILYVKNGIDVRVVPIEEWHASGFAASGYGSLQIWMNKGFSFEEAVRFAACGFSPVTAENYKKTSETLPDFIIDIPATENELISDEEDDFEPASLDSIEDMEEGCDKTKKKKKVEEKDKDEDGIDPATGENPETDKDLEDDEDKKFMKMQNGYVVPESVQKLSEGKNANELLWTFLWDKYKDNSDFKGIPPEIIKKAEELLPSFLKDAGITGNKDIVTSFKVAGKEYFLAVYLERQKEFHSGMRFKLGYVDKSKTSGYDQINSTRSIPLNAMYSIVSSWCKIELKKDFVHFFSFIK